MISEETKREMGTWWSIVWPSWIANFLIVGMDLTDLTFLGHYDNGRYQAVASAALIVIGFTTALFVNGPALAVRVLSANAFGAQQTELAGRRLQIGVAVAVGLALLCSPVWAFAGTITKSLANSNIDFDKADTFGQFRLLGIVPNATFDVLSSWLVGRRIVMPAMRACIIAFVLNIALNAIFLFGLGSWGGFGFVGSALATACSRWVALICLVIISQGEVRKCWPKEMAPSFTPQRIKEFMGYAGFMICRGVLENLGWQINAIFAVTFGSAQLATNNCMGNAILLLNSALVGFNAGTGTRVAHHCVQDDKQSFIRVRRVAATVMFAWSLVVMLVFLVGQKQVGAFFSDNSQVQSLTSELCILMGVMYFVMSLFFLCMAILNGTGRPGIILVAFIAGSYLVGLPLSYVFAFHVPSSAFAWWPNFQAPRAVGLGILGIWLGGTLGYATTTAVAGFKASQVLTQWPELVAQAKKTAEVKKTATLSFVDHTLSMVESTAKDASVLLSHRESYA